MNLSYDYEITAPSTVTVNPDDYLTVRSFDELLKLLDEEQSEEYIDALVGEADAIELWEEIQRRRKSA